MDGTACSLPYYCMHCRCSCFHASISTIANVWLSGWTSESHAQSVVSKFPNLMRMTRLNLRYLAAWRWLGAAIESPISPLSLVIVSSLNSHSFSMTLSKFRMNPLGGMLYLTGVYLGRSHCAENNNNRMGSSCALGSELQYNGACAPHLSPAHAELKSKKNARRLLVVAPVMLMACDHTRNHR